MLLAFVSVFETLTCPEYKSDHSWKDDMTSENEAVNNENPKS